MSLKDKQSLQLLPGLLCEKPIVGARAVQEGYNG